MLGCNADAFGGVDRGRCGGTRGVYDCHRICTPRTPYCLDPRRVGLELLRYCLCMLLWVLVLRLAVLVLEFSGTDMEPCLVLTRAYVVLTCAYVVPRAQCTRGTDVCVYGTDICVCGCRVRMCYQSFPCLRPTERYHRDLPEVYGTILCYDSTGSHAMPAYAHAMRCAVLRSRMVLPDR
eukprot:3934597-Rhodomonas_salina.1